MGLCTFPPETLEQYGAVSEETVIEMVKGAMKALKTDCAVATSGIAYLEVVTRKSRWELFG